MLTLILTIGFIAAILVIIIVLVQNPKGGGLAANFSSSNQIFGAQRTSEGVEKLTWIFASIILVVSLFASSFNGAPTTAGGSDASKDTKFEERINATAPKGTAKPVAPGNQAPPADPTQQTVPVK